MIHDEIGRAVDRLPVTRIAAGALRTVTEEGRHAEVVDSALVGLSTALNNNRETLRTRFSDEAPWWLPGAVEDRIFDRLLDGAIAYLDEVTRIAESRDPQDDRRVAPRADRSPGDVAGPDGAG